MTDPAPQPERRLDDLIKAIREAERRVIPSWLVPTVALLAALGFMSLGAACAMVLDQRAEWKDFNDDWERLSVPAYMESTDKEIARLWAKQQALDDMMTVVIGQGKAASLQAADLPQKATDEEE